MKGLRPRLVVTFTVVAAATSGALAVTSYFVVERAVIKRATDVAVREGKAAIAEAVVRLPPGASPAEAKALAVRLAIGDADVVTVAAGGAPARAVPAALRDAAVTDQVSWVRTGSGRGAVVVVGGRLPDGPGLFLFFPLRAEATDLATLRNVLAAAGLGLVLVSALVGLVAARGLLRPLRSARLAAQRLEVGLLETRLAEEGADEFTDLARAFNRMADALERTVGDLRTLEESQRRFVSDVSHELRTPLTALTMAADVLDANSAGLNDTGRRAARLLVVESRRLSAMVEDLMEISRFDAGVPAIAREPVDVGDLVARALDARGWTGRVTVAGAGTGAVASADPRRLDTILANLVGNALEHGAPPVVVSVSSGETGVVITVTDHGAGIPAEHLDRVFDRFYKADPSRSRGGGSGLGLAIARENARLHGGDVTVASVPGEGATFTLTLPGPTG